MTRSAASLTVQDLPPVVPVFAVSGAVLLPTARLPLTVFEPRYLALTDDVLGAGRLFGLVQPLPDAQGQTGPVAGLYSVGTLARITAFGETGDGRYLITALGLTRFKLMGEDSPRSGYRRVLADYAPFMDDLAVHLGPDGPIDRRRLLAAMGAYLGRQGVAPDLGKLDGAPDQDLVTGMAMAAPLSPEERQALLEASGTVERARLMTAIFELALLSDVGPSHLH